MAVHHQVLLYGFVIAVVIGAVANKTNFCTMGAVSDWVNMGKTGRLWAWFTAIAVAVAGVLVLEAAGIVALDSTIPPYRSASFAWSRYLSGGILFGIGMTLAGGCVNKTLVNAGGGNLKSVLVLVVVGAMAYLMTKTRFYEMLFHPWVNGSTIDLTQYGARGQQLSEVLAAVTGLGNAAALHYGIGIALVVTLAVLALRVPAFRSNRNNVISAITIGLAVVAAWYLTGGPLGRAAIEAVEWMDNRPMGVGVQSYTFVNAAGESLTYALSPANTLLVTFGVVAVAGVFVGSLIMALATRRFRFVWFTSAGDFTKHMIGAVLMGIGGVLAMGCTVGQGITGVSTLSLGSVIALVSIIFGSALTMKIQYYRMVYENEASFAAAFLSSLADMHLVPHRMRALDPP